MGLPWAPLIGPNIRSHLLTRLIVDFGCETICQTYIVRRLVSAGCALIEVRFLPQPNFLGAQRRWSGTPLCLCPTGPVVSAKIMAATITDDLVQLYAESDALGLAELVRRKEVTPTELTEIAIDQIEKLDPKLNAVVIRAFDRARAQAAQPPGDGVFAGVPYLLKNLGSACAGLPMTNGLAYRKDYVCPSDSEMVGRIKASGLNILGRTNVPENGWCIATEPRLYGPTLNPWNTSVTPGGSSGGTAAAVAARMVPMAEASDGGGSIRAPASCCAVLGLKPSRGRITYGPDNVDLWFGSISNSCDHAHCAGRSGIFGRYGGQHARRSLHGSPPGAELA